MIKAGFARVDVTPPLGTPIAGYFSVRLAEGVLDPIELNAVAFGNEHESALLIAADFTGMTMARITPLRARIAAMTGVPAERILITSLHQHTSIYVGDEIGDAEDYAMIKDGAYLDFLDRKFCDVAKMALSDMSEARLLANEGATEKMIAFTRRYVMPDRTIRTNPPSKYGVPVRRTEAPDNTVRLLRFVREGKCEIDIVNFSTHPDVISGNLLSADWPGFVRRFVESDRPDVACLCMVGCQGDSNHLDFFKPKEERFPEGMGYPHSRYMGRMIADTVGALLQDGTEHTGDTVFGGVKLIYNKTNTAGEEYYDEAVQFIADYEAGEPKKTAHVTDIAYAMRVRRLLTAPIRRAVPVTVLGIGDVAFVGYGGEPFTHYGTAARAGAEDKTVLCACCANGYEGYLLTEQAFREGGYEAATSLYTPGLEKQCVDAALTMLKQF
ncbi:MAG: hypothetical protein E7624_01810 [Ruminococcaceae bacterium]|nr:hypothetical protein [Oscillospiraceae bacterium]